MAVDIFGGPRSRGRVRVTFVAVILLGVVAAGALLWAEDGETVLLVVVALGVLWGTAAHLYFLYYSSRRRRRRQPQWVVDADGSRLRIRLRRDLPLGLFGAAWVVLSLAAATPWLDADSGRYAGLGPLIIPLGLLLGTVAAVAVADLLRMLARPDRALVLDEAGLTYRGFSYEIRIAWDQLSMCMRESLQSPRRTVGLRVWARADRRADRQVDRLEGVRRLRWMCHVEPPSQGASFAIPYLVLDDPEPVRRFVEEMILLPPDRRSGRLSHLAYELSAEPVAGS